MTRNLILEFALKFCLAEKIFKKIMVSQNLRQAHLLEVGLTKIPRDHETLSIVRHIRLRVDISSMKSCLGFRPSPLCVKQTWTVGRSVSALSTNESSFQWSWAFSLVCEVALITKKKLRVRLAWFDSWQQLLWLPKCVCKETPQHPTGKSTGLDRNYIVKNLEVSFMGTYEVTYHSIIHMLPYVNFFIDVVE